MGFVSSGSKDRSEFPVICRKDRIFYIPKEQKETDTCVFLPQFRGMLVLGAHLINTRCKWELGQFGFEDIHEQHVGTCSHSQVKKVKEILESACINSLPD